YFTQVCCRCSVPTPRRPILGTSGLSQHGSSMTMIPHRTGDLGNVGSRPRHQAVLRLGQLGRRNMHRKALAVAASSALAGLFPRGSLGAADSADNAAPGAGNAFAIEISGKSALVRSAKALIDRRIREMQNAQLRTATEDAVDNPATCVRHRAGIDAATKAA